MRLAVLALVLAGPALAQDSVEEAATRLVGLINVGEFGIGDAAASISVSTECRLTVAYEEFEDGARIYSDIAVPVADLDFDTVREHGNEVRATALIAVPDGTAAMTARATGLSEEEQEGFIRETSGSCEGDTCTGGRNLPIFPIVAFGEGNQDRRAEAVLILSRLQSLCASG